MHVEVSSKCGGMQGFSAHFQNQQARRTNVRGIQAGFQVLLKEKPGHPPIGVIQYPLYQGWTDKGANSCCRPKAYSMIYLRAVGDACPLLYRSDFSNVHGPDFDLLQHFYNEVFPGADDVKRRDALAVFVCGQP